MNAGHASCVLCGLALAGLVLTGCASATGIVPAGGEEYMSAKQQATGFPGLGNMKAELLTEADAFCKSKGSTLAVTKETETQPPYVLGNYPRAEIRFKCIAR
jgi:hypothetical protein